MGSAELLTLVLISWGDLKEPLLMMPYHTLVSDAASACFTLKSLNVLHENTLIPSKINKVPIMGTSCLMAEYIGADYRAKRPE